jgi:hypothetical protein
MTHWRRELLRKLDFLGCFVRDSGLKATQKMSKLCGSSTLRSIKIIDSRMEYGYHFNGFFMPHIAP